MLDEKRRAKNNQTRLVETSRAIRDYMITAGRLSVAGPSYHMSVKFAALRDTLSHEKANQTRTTLLTSELKRQNAGKNYLDLKASRRSVLSSFSHRASHRRKPSCTSREELSAETASAEHSRPCVILTKVRFASGQLPRLAPVCS